MKSATQLGKMIGKSAREVNELLKAKGYIDGTPGNYSMTALIRRTPALDDSSFFTSLRSQCCTI